MAVVTTAVYWGTFPVCRSLGISQIHFPTQCPGYLQPMLTQVRQPWGMEAEGMMLLSLATWARSQLDIHWDARTWGMAKMKPHMNSYGLKIPSQEQTFLRIGIICFWQYMVSFWEWEEKQCGKSFGNLARPLGHELCVTKQIFAQLSVNQSKPDRLSLACWLQNATREVPSLNMTGNLLNSDMYKRASESV